MPLRVILLATASVGACALIKPRRWTVYCPAVLTRRYLPTLTLRFVTLAMTALALGMPIRAQQRVNARNSYERVIAVVPLTGKGTMQDPRRPLYAPTPSQVAADKQRSGIIGFTFQLTDDGKYAIAEFVAKNRSALLPIINSKDAVKLFEKGKNKQKTKDVEDELKKFKKDFDSKKFGVAVQ